MRGDHLIAYAPRSYATAIRVALEPHKRAGTPWAAAWAAVTTKHRPPADWGGFRPTPGDPGIDPVPDDGEETALRFLHRVMRSAYLDEENGRPRLALELGEAA